MISQIDSAFRLIAAKVGPYKWWLLLASICAIAPYIALAGGALTPLWQVLAVAGFGFFVLHWIAAFWEPGGLIEKVPFPGGVTLVTALWAGLYVPLAITNIISALATP